MKIIIWIPITTSIPQGAVDPHGSKSLLAVEVEASSQIEAIDRLGAVLSRLCREQKE